MIINITVKGLTGRIISLTGINDAIVTESGLRALVRAAEHGSALFTDAMYGNISLDSNPTINLINNRTETLSVAGIINNDKLTATPLDGRENITKQAAQEQKLIIASAKREYLGIKTKFTYDLTSLPDTYNGNVPGVDDNPNDGGLIDGRPWTT